MAIPPLRISVVIPNYNGGDLLRRCLEALNMERDQLHEIIVVDDASTDDSIELARSMNARVIRRVENGGPAAARNDGALDSTGEVIWFVDSDTEIHPGATRVLMDHFVANPGLAAVIGSYDDTPSAPAAASQFKNLFHHYVHQQGPDVVSSFWSGCGAIRRDAFDAVGGFDAVYWREPMIEDIHLGYELGKRGLQIHILKMLQVTHHKAWTIKSLVKTDIFHRAVPWTALLLKHDKYRNRELNLGNHARYSVICVYAAILCFLAMIWRWEFLGGACLLLAAVVPLNWGLLSFFKSKRDFGFFLKCVTLLWLYYWYCGVGLVLGILKYLKER
ncbi:MAG: glycosyltransferase [Candidatus Sumerlaeota bacterium]